MDHFEFAQDGGGVRRQDHLLQVVDHDFVAAKRAKGGLHRGRDGSAGIDIAESCSILGVIANGCQYGLQIVGLLVRVYL